MFDGNQKLFYFILVRKHNGMLPVKNKKEILQLNIRNFLTCIGRNNHRNSAKGVPHIFEYKECVWQ